MEKNEYENIITSQDYGSEFEYDSERERKRKKRKDLAGPAPAKKSKLPSKDVVTQEYNKEEGRIMRFHIIAMDAYARHKKFVNDYLRYYGGSAAEFKRDTSKDKTDHDVIRENHRFLWTDEDNAEESWEKSLAKRYWNKLFKEYCITDLSRYKENKIAMRWRIEKEVVSGKGQFTCGNKTCIVTEKLRSWEVNFGYVEHGEKKNALVKLRLCPECSEKLNYHSRRKEVIPQKAVSQKKSEDSNKNPKKSKKKKKKKKRGSSSEDSSEESDSWVEKPSTSEQGQKETESKDAEVSEKDMWSGPVKIVQEKTREEEFDDYFEDMFL